MKFSAHRSRGFTLLEVILALGLSVLVIGVLAMAIQVQLRATQTNRVDVAQAQLARALLKRIGDDVREAVWYEPFDPLAMVAPPQSQSANVTGQTQSSGSGSGGSGGSSMASAGGSSGGSGGGSSSVTSGVSGASTAGGASGATGAAGASGAGGASSAGTAGTAGGASGSGGGGSGGSGGSVGGGGSGGGSGGSSGSGGGSGGSGGSSTNAPAPDPPPMPPPLPGMFGGPNWLHVDVSKFPRSDQYATAPGMAAGASTPAMSPGGDRISDVKSIAYFQAGTSGLPQGLAGPATSGPKPRGLLRREADRAVTVWAATGGGATNGSPPESLAPEVVSIGFRYFDGQSWQQSWDSRQRVGLPKAVEIEVSFLVGSLNDGDGDAASLVDLREKVTHKMVVSPAGWRPPNAYSTYYQQIMGQVPSAQPGTTSSNTSR